MTTAVAICSNALIRLGSDPISDFSEGDATGANLERARIAANLWPTVRRQVLMGHSWNGCLKRVLLSPMAEPPAFGWGKQFALPGDWLRHHQVGLDDVPLEYRTEGRKILCNEDQLPLLYVWDNPNAADYGAALVGALEFAMQAAMAYPITKSTSLADSLKADLQDVLRFARAADSADDPTPTLGGPGAVVRSRYAGSR